MAMMPLFCMNVGMNGSLLVFIFCLLEVEITGMFPFSTMIFTEWQKLQHDGFSSICTEKSQTLYSNATGLNDKVHKVTISSKL